MHLMIDLETLSTAVDAAITQIGLAPFRIDGTDPLEEGVLINVDPQSCIDLGMRVDWSTTHWWMMQSQEARDALPRPGEGLPLPDALDEVEDYILGLAQRHPGDLKIWSNGATFDIPILGHAFTRLGRREPWRYSAARDTRTLAMLALNAIRPEPEVKHNALHDAIAQVRWVQNMWREAQGGMVSCGPAPGGAGEVIAGERGEHGGEDAAPPSGLASLGSTLPERE